MECVFYNASRNHPLNTPRLNWPASPTRFFLLTLAIARIQAALLWEGRAISRQSAYAMPADRAAYRDRARRPESQKS